MSGNVSKRVDSQSDLTDPIQSKMWAERVARAINDYKSYGNIYADGNATETAIAVTNTFYQITIFDTNGPSLLTTPDHTNDHITILKDGDYKVDVSISLDGVGGSGATYRASAYLNNGTTEIANVHGSLSLAGGTDKEMALSLSGIATLAVDDTVEVWIKNGTGIENIIVEDISLTVVQVGRNE